MLFFIPTIILTFIPTIISTVVATIIPTSGSGLAPDTELANIVAAVATLDPDVPIFAPPTAPRVLNQPVVAVILISSISDNQDSMASTSAPVPVSYTHLTLPTKRIV